MSLIYTPNLMGGLISAREAVVQEGRCPGGQAENWSHLLFSSSHLKRQGSKDQKN